MLTFAIGDIHGCFDKLERLIARCKQYAHGEQSRFVFLGDYIDRGPDSRQVVEFVMNFQQTTPETICLKGNNENVLERAQSSPPIMEWWLQNGGDVTLQSYGITSLSDFPQAHLRWMRSLRLQLYDDLRFFVHAGVDPTLDEPLLASPMDALLWIREPFLSSDRDYGRLVVHGHTKVAEPDLRANRLNIDTVQPVIGRHLTAAVFDDTRRDPLTFLTS